MTECPVNSYAHSSLQILAIPPLWWELYGEWNQLTEMQYANKTKNEKKAVSTKSAE